MSDPCHSLACPDQDQHPQHVWGEDPNRWWCLGTDPVAAVNAHRQYTLDGVLIQYGMTLVDYDLNECKVIGVQSMSHGTIWFKTTTGMFDASRLWATKPRAVR